MKEAVKRQFLFCIKSSTIVLEMGLRMTHKERANELLKLNYHYPKLILLFFKLHFSKTG